MTRTGLASGTRSLRLLARPWQLLCLLLGAVAVLLFFYKGLHYADETQSELRLIPYLRYDERLDFNYFYGAADMVLHGDADLLYPDCSPGDYPQCSEPIHWPGDPLYSRPGVDDYTKAKAIVRGSYFGPPAIAFLQAPLALLSFRAAYWLFSALSLGALAAFLALAWRAGRGVAEMPLFVLGVLAFVPVHETLIMGHLAIFYTLALAGGLLLLRAGRPELAGLCLAVLALKPQWAVLPALYLLVRGERRAFAVMAVASALIFFVPFLATGLEVLPRYLDFVRDVADFNLEEAPHMFSWNGFLFKLGAEPVNRPLYFGLLALSVLPLLVVWRGRDYRLGVAATVVAMLLLSNHSVWYDWALLAVAALFLLLRSPEMSRGQRVEMWVVLLALYVAAGQSTAALLQPDRHFVDWYREAFYSLTPVAFASLLWLASLTLRDGGLALVTSRRPAPRPAGGS